MPFSAAEATKRRTKSAPTGREPTRKRPRSASPSGVVVRALERADPLPRALDAAPDGRVEDAAAGDLEAGEAGRVEHLGEPQQLGGRHLAGERLLREQANSGVDQPRHVVDPTEWKERSKLRSRSRASSACAVEEPVVLRDLTNVLVHLAPSPVVARVPMTFTRTRGREWVEKELELAALLARCGRFRSPPRRRVPPGPHERDGFLVTLWEYVEHDRERAARRRPPPARRSAGSTTRSRMSSPRGSSTSPGSTRSSASPRRCRSAAASSRRFRRGLGAARKVVDGLDVAAAADPRRRAPRQRPAHAAGPLWGDFENVCLGPRELDLACNELRARAQGRDARRRRVPRRLRRPRRGARRAADPGPRALPRGLDVRARRADAGGPAARGGAAAAGSSTASGCEATC